MERYVPSTRIKFLTRCTSYFRCSIFYYLHGISCIYSSIRKEGIEEGGAQLGACGSGHVKCTCRAGSGRCTTACPNTGRTHEAENERARGEASERRTLPRRIDSADGRTEGQTDPPWIYSDSAERERALNARPAAANAHWEKSAHA